MSLFGAIRRLYRKDKFQMEDFHTEIVAQVIRNSRELAIRWLRDIRAANSHMTNVISIDTQVPFSALEENEPGSRVDMVIQLRGSDVRQIVFIESKIDSKENPGQLSKYAGVIRKLQADFNYIKIVYVTRDFEMLPRDAPADVITPCRWFQFYDVLKDHTNRDGLAEQLKLFMEENRMSQRNQFTALDSLALGNFRAAKSLMDETLWSGVSDKFKNILGAVSPQKRAITSLREWGGYVMNATFGNADFYCHLGYYLPNEDPTEFPWVGVCGFRASQNQPSARRFSQPSVTFS